MSDPVALARQIFAQAVKACSGERIVANGVSREGTKLLVKDSTIELDRFERVWVCGAGKASPSMAGALVRWVEGQLAGGLVVGKAPSGSGEYSVRRGFPFDLAQAGHPVPDERSLQAGEEMLAIAPRLGKNDLVLFALSGGASALMEALVGPITLDDLAQTNEVLLASGWPIERMNAVRKRLSRIKNGGLARAFAPATVVCFVMSDVIGDDLYAIGSAPFLAQPLPVLADLPNGLPGRVRDLLLKPYELASTPVVRHEILANAETAASSAQAAAIGLGMACDILRPAFQDDAALVGKHLGRYVLAQPPGSVTIAFGESTVQLGPKRGTGGRAQEVALAAAIELDGHHGVAILVAGTDGTDGPTEVAGAVVDGETLQRAMQQGIDAQACLEAHDSFRFHTDAGSHVKTGPTGTNLNEMAVLVRE